MELVMGDTRLSYVLSHPIQYFSPLFVQMANTPGMHLRVYYCVNPSNFIQIDQGFGKEIKWDVPLLEGYRSFFLKNWSPWPSLANKFWGLVNPGIVKALIKDKSEILIIHGWSSFTNCLAVVAGCILGKRIWLRGENPMNQELMKSNWLIMLKRIFLQYGIFKLTDRFLYIGKQNRDFYLFYGVPESKLIHAPYAVNNSFFSSLALSHVNLRSHMRKQYGIPQDAVVILFSGKYILKKRPIDLLRAYSSLEDLPVALVMVGEGNLRGAMEQFITSSKLKNVFLTGFINQSEIGNFYCLADIFVLPSGMGETWGLVVNEAMLFQLPVVVSSTVGCAVDLVEEGQNGFVYDEGNIGQLSLHLRKLIGSAELRKTAGARSGEIIKNFSYSVMIRNMVQDINSKQ